jgi:small-conductance mechanosensitive channel
VISITDCFSTAPQDGRTPALRESEAMTYRLRLKLAALIFAILWTGWMMWWSAARQPADFVMISICGVLVGLVWYWSIRWYRGYLARKLFPRKRAG